MELMKSYQLGKIFFIGFFHFGKSLTLWRLRLHSCSVEKSLFWHRNLVWSSYLHLENGGKLRCLDFREFDHQGLITKLHLFTENEKQTCASMVVNGLNVFERENKNMFVCIFSGSTASTEQHQLQPRRPTDNESDEGEPSSVSSNSVQLKYCSYCHSIFVILFLPADQKNI